jgi:hypothetical protein
MPRVPLLLQSRYRQIVAFPANPWLSLSSESPLAINQDRSIRHRQALPVHGEFINSRGDWRLIKPATVLLPPIRSKAYR